jgi:hypothetical protein
MDIDYDDWYSNLSIPDRIDLIKLYDNDIISNVYHINMPIQQIIFHIKRGKILYVKTFDEKTLKIFFSSMNDENEFVLVERNLETNEIKTCKLFDVPMLGRQTIDKPIVKVVFI